MTCPACKSSKIQTTGEYWANAVKVVNRCKVCKFLWVEGMDENGVSVNHKYPEYKRK